jgi:NADPH-dependent curcumin reductase CurA
VAASRHPDFRAGDPVAGFMSWAEHHLVAGGQGLHKVEVDAARPLSYYLGLLGMPGEGRGWAVG